MTQQLVGLLVINGIEKRESNNTDVQNDKELGKVAGL
jgi:hypothetical protein